MVRKIMFVLDVAVFSALHVMALAQLLGSLVPAFAQAQPAVPINDVKSLGHFLESYPAGASETSASKQELWQRFGAGIIAWRVVENGESKSILVNGRAGFANECAKLDGKINPADKRAAISITKIEGRGAAWAGIAHPDICLGSDGKAVAALYAYSFTHRALFKNAVGDRAAFFLISKDAIEANMSFTLQQWHFRLRQGEETNCGYVLELRGTLVQVAKGERVLWMRRDQLRPAGQGTCPQKSE